MLFFRRFMARCVIDVRFVANKKVQPNPPFPKTLKKGYK
jgi:hypothetical protein